MVGFKIIVTTNQSGVARGYFGIETIEKINKEILNRLRKKGAIVDAMFYCPHHPDENCECRKPATGMIEAAKKRFNLDLTKSFCIGDKLTDIEFGKNAGAKSILVMTGYGEKEAKKIKEKNVKPDYLAKNMIDASLWILRNQKV